MEKSLRQDCPPELKVIETFRVEDGIAPRLELHLKRLAATCGLLEIDLDQARLRSCLDALPSQGVLRARLTVDLSGHVELGYAVLGASKSRWTVAIAPERISSDDPWLQVKTTQRMLYEQMRGALPAGVDEWIFLNERDEVCEGTITNIFVERDGRLLTPPLRSGLLPGVLRESLLDTGGARDQVIKREDLCGSLWLGNSLRGLIAAELVELG